MSLLFRTASMLNVGAAVTLKTLKYGRTTLNYTFATSAFGVDRVVKLDAFESRRKNAAEKLKSASEELRLRIVSGLDTMNAINSRDVQELIFTAEEQDLELVIAALKKLEMQSDRLRFSDFIMDAVVMRMFAYLNLPEEACKVFLDEDLKKLFLGYNSIVILLDLLYKNGLYQNIIDCIDCLERRQNLNVWSSRAVAAFYITSCLKIKTPESLEKGLLHYDKILRYREPVPLLTLLSALIAVYSNPQKVDYFLKLAPNNPNYSDFRANILLLCLTSAGNLSDIEEYLHHNKCVLAKDTYDSIVTLFKKNNSDKIDEVFKDCVVLDTSLEDLITQEYWKNPEGKGKDSREFKSGRQRRNQ